MHCNIACRHFLAFAFVVFGRLVLSFFLAFLGLAATLLQQRFAVFVQLQLDDLAVLGMDADLHALAIGFLARDFVDVDFLQNTQEKEERARMGEILGGAYNKAKGTASYAPI